MDSPKLVRLSDTIDLVAQVAGGDGDRFAKLFRMAIAKLPADAVEQIARHWGAITHSNPVIRLEPAVIRKNNGTGVAIGMHEDSGRTLRFCGPALAEMTDELGVSLIVHELAHAHAYAEVALNVMAPKMRARLESICHDLNQLEQFLEAYADSRMEQWGCDPEALRQWCDAYLRRNGLIK